MTLDRIIFGDIHLRITADGREFESYIDDMDDSLELLIRFTRCLKDGRLPHAALSDRTMTHFVVQETDQPGFCRLIIRGGQETGGVINIDSSRSLHEAFVAWQYRFADAEYVGLEVTPDFDWEGFHREGITLARDLKEELGGSARVFYEKPTEDPDYTIEERREVLSGGALLVLDVYGVNTIGEQRRTIRVTQPNTLYQIFEATAQRDPGTEALEEEVGYRHMTALADMYTEWTLDERLSPEQKAKCLGWVKGIRTMAEEVGPNWNPAASQGTVRAGHYRPGGRR